LRGFPVTIQVTDANGNNVTIDQREVDEDKKYSTTLANTSGELWQSSGTYTVNVLYGTEFRTAQTQFEFTRSYVPPEPEIQNTMNIEIIDDKVSVWGTVNPEEIILTNGPSLQTIKPDGAGGIVTAISNGFEWDGTSYSTFFWLSNFIDQQDDSTFKLWSGNGAKETVLIQKTAFITFTVPVVENYTEPILENYTEPILENYTEPILENYTEPTTDEIQPSTSSRSGSCRYCYVDTQPAITESESTTTLDSELETSDSSSEITFVSPSITTDTPELVTTPDSVIAG